MSIHGVCASAALLATWGPMASTSWPDAPPPSGSVAVSAELETRGVAEGIVDSVESEHFVYAWGAAWTPDATQQAVVLDAMEATWADQVDDLGFTPPPGSARYKLNVYQAGSGITVGGVPIDMPGAGGWNGLDPEGWVYIAFPAGMWEVDAQYAADGVNAPGDTITGMLAHEFQHACQFGATTWSGNTEQIWFTEALAEWAALRAVPGDFSIEQSLIALLILPHLSLEWSDASFYAGSTPEALDIGDDELPPGLERYHFYSGWPLLTVVAEELGAQAVVSWAEDRGTYDTPVESLTALLAAADSDPLAAWAEALGRARTDELPGAAWGAYLFEASAAFPGWTANYGDVILPLEVGGGWQQHPDVALLPQRMGFSRWRVEAPPAELRILFEGDAVGSAGTSAAWALVAVALDDDGEGEAWTLPLDAGVPLVVDLADAAAFELLVVPGAERYVPDEVFDYRVEALALDRSETAGGCALTSAAESLPPHLALLLLLPVVVRRRTREPAQDVPYQCSQSGSADASAQVTGSTSPSKGTPDTSRISMGRQ